MINIQLMDMNEYVPVNGDVVDIYLLNNYLNANVVVGIELTTATCCIHYQGYCPEDNNPLPIWTSHSTEEMAKVKFDTPFLHVGVIGGQSTRIVGHRYISDKEIEALGVEAYRERIGLMTEEKYKPSLPTVYYKKEWFFVLDDDRQIQQGNPDKEVLGIMHKEQLEIDLKEKIRLCLGA